MRNSRYKREQSTLMLRSNNRGGIKQSLHHISPSHRQLFTSATTATWQSTHVTTSTVSTANPHETNQFLLTWNQSFLMKPDCYCVCFKHQVWVYFDISSIIPTIKLLLFKFFALPNDPSIINYVGNIFIPPHLNTVYRIIWF